MPKHRYRKALAALTLAACLTALPAAALDGTPDAPAPGAQTDRADIADAPEEGADRLGAWRWTDEAPPEGGAAVPESKADGAVPEDAADGAAAEGTSGGADPEGEGGGAAPEGEAAAAPAQAAQGAAAPGGLTATTGSAALVGVGAYSYLRRRRQEEREQQRAAPKQHVYFENHTRNGTLRPGEQDDIE